MVLFFYRTGFLPNGGALRIFPSFRRSAWLITAWLLAKRVAVDIVGLVRGNDAIFAENSGDELGACVRNVRTTHLRGIHDRERGEASAGFA